MKDNTLTLIPHLACRDAADAIDFYARAFGADPITVHKLPDGMLMHAALSIGDAMFFLSEGCADMGCPSPLDVGGSPVTLHLQVGDCDAAFERAIAAGCTVQMPLQDMFWGDRYGVLADPWGHRWSIATHVREVSPEEIARAGAEFCGKA